MEEQEIDLRDYLRVLKRKWKLIVRITVGCAVISAVCSLFLPNVYESLAIIEPAKINNVPLETSAIGELLFKNPLNPYLKEIAKQMGLKEKEAYILSRKFGISDKLGYIQIIGKGKSPDIAKKLTDVITSLILKRHENLIKNALEISENEMSSVKEQFLMIKNELERIDKTLFKREVATTQGQGYVFQGLIQLKENALKRQLDLEARIKSKEMELKYYTKAASIIAEPALPLEKVATSKRKIVLIVTVLGFMLSIFSAFVVEFFQKNPL